jgi:phage shock protein PspC (stress-responsive transcriptional regulator)
MILGVFQGIADWTGINVWVWRVIGIILLCSMHFWAGVAIYLLAAVLMPRY